MGKLGKQTDPSPNNLFDILRFEDILTRLGVPTFVKCLLLLFVVQEKTTEFVGFINDGTG